MNLTHEALTMTAPTIERIETCLVDLPTIRPHKLSVATMYGQTLMLVKVYCSDGVVGIGDAPHHVPVRAALQGRRIGQGGDVFADLPRVRVVLFELGP